MNWKPELDDLARREAFAREMGGVDKVKRQRDQGRLTVRERIHKLLDQNSFHEIGAISGTAEYDEQGELTNLTPANCVFGRGRSMAVPWSSSATISPCAAARPTPRFRPSR
jgi:acetyl-CoA carboxylase carboxyltransferase component